MTSNKAVKVFTCVFVLDEKSNKILLGYKKRGLLEKKWNGFGGKVEPGETILEAAERLVPLFILKILSQFFI